jgi:hypothetical protein
MPSSADATAARDNAARLVDIGAIVRASARPQRQYSASANGPRYSAVIGKTKFIKPTASRSGPNDPSTTRNAVEGRLVLHGRGSVSIRLAMTCRFIPCRRFLPEQNGRSAAIIDANARFAHPDTG